MYPADLRYSREHEWVRIEGDHGQVGITDYAQKQLGDVVYVQLPEVGRTFTRGDIFGSVESVKAVSDLFCPLSGEVTAVNADLTTRPEAVNKNPHGSWMITLRIADPREAGLLLDAGQYAALVG